MVVTFGTRPRRVKVSRTLTHYLYTIQYLFFSCNVLEDTPDPCFATNFTTLQHYPSHTPPDSITREWGESKHITPPPQSDWPGLFLFCCYQPSSANRIDLNFCFLKIPILPPPPQVPAVAFRMFLQNTISEDCRSQHMKVPDPAAVTEIANEIVPGAYSIDELELHFRSQKRLNFRCFGTESEALWPTFKSKWWRENTRVYHWNLSLYHMSIIPILSHWHK